MLIVCKCRQRTIKWGGQRKQQGDLRMDKQAFANYALSNLIKESIIEDIVIGKIKPGAKLIETRYAEEFGTSRAPVREAFYLLTMEGYAEKIPRRGTVVKGFSIEEIRDLLAIRNLLEDFALQKLTGRDISRYVEKMEEKIKEMQSCQGRREYARLNNEFHRQIILASGSVVVNNLYSKLGTALLSVQTMSFKDENYIKMSLNDHIKLVALLHDTCYEEARSLLMSHNEAVLPRIETDLLNQASH